MVTFVPTRGVLDHLREVDQLNAWGEVVDDLTLATSTPALGYETRQRLCGDKFEAFVEPGRHDGDDVMWVVFLRSRHRCEALPREQQVVGHDAKVTKSRRSFGSGQRWPTTWEELVARVKAFPGAEVQRGGKHLNVLLHGKQVQTLPHTASDRRALLNACQILRNVGIDVRRKERT